MDNKSNLHDPIKNIKHLTKLDQFLNDKNIDELKKLSIYGYNPNQYRLKIWKLLLLQSNKKLVMPKYTEDEYKTLNKYYNQIDKDIPRSMNHHDITINMNQIEQEVVKKTLRDIIQTIFSEHHNDLHYIQGYHSIALIFVLVCQAYKTNDAKILAYNLLKSLSYLHIRNNLRNTLEKVIESLNLVFPILKLYDLQLYNLLKTAQVQSFFSLSWILTWFSHNLNNYHTILRIFDFLLASDPIMPVYLVVMLIVSQKEQLLLLPSPDQGTIHSFFQSIDHLQHDNIELLLTNALRLYKQFPYQQIIKQQVKQQEVKQQVKKATTTIK